MTEADEREALRVAHRRWANLGSWAAWDSPYGAGSEANLYVRTALVRAIEQSPPTDRTLYRGIDMAGVSRSDVLASHAPGTKLKMHPSFFTLSWELAASFAVEWPLRGGAEDSTPRVPTILRLHPGARALSLQDDDPISLGSREKQWLTGGVLEVLRAEWRTDLSYSELCAFAEQREPTAQERMADRFVRRSAFPPWSSLRPHVLVDVRQISTPTVDYVGTGAEFKRDPSQPAVLGDTRHLDELLAQHPHQF